MSCEMLFSIFAAPKVDEVAADLRQLGVQAWQALIEAALLHKCAPMLLERLRQWDFLEHVPDPIRRRLAQITFSNAARNLKRYSDLDQLSAALGAATPVIVLKGGRLARTHYRNISLRTMVDVDVLARPEHLSQVAERLTTLGYKRVETRSAPRYVELIHDISYRRDGLTIELHRSLLNAGDPFSIDYEGIWKRAIPAGKEGCFYFSAEDQLVHLCLHAAYHHKLTIGLYAFIDIGLMCSDMALDWQRLVERAQSWRAERCVFLALKMAEQLVGAPVPAGVVRDLQPPDFKVEMLRKAADTIRLTMNNEAAGRFANTLAWYMTIDAWRRLPYTLQRRFLDPLEHRSRWSTAEDATWLAQLRPLLYGTAQLLYSRRQWQLVHAHILGTRLSRWMERPL